MSGPASAPRELSTDRLALWTPSPEHAEDMLRYHLDNRAHLERWAPGPRHPPEPDERYTVKAWRQKLVRSEHEHSAGRAVRLVISWRDDQTRRILGLCNLTEITRGPHLSCLLGYSLDEREQRKGIMTEAVRAVIGFAFDTLGLHRIMANYMPCNERSGALLDRLGFTVEGYARRFLFVNGAWRDHILTALINPARIEPP